MLLTPGGFITDTFGFLCLLPGSRHWLASQALKRMTVAGGQNRGRSFFFSAGDGAGPFGQGPFGRQRPFDRDANGNIIEGEYQDQTRNDRGGQLQQGGQSDQDEQEKK